MNNKTKIPERVEPSEKEKKLRKYSVLNLIILLPILTDLIRLPIRLEMLTTDDLVYKIMDTAWGIYFYATLIFFWVAVYKCAKYNRISKILYFIFFTLFMFVAIPMTYWIIVYNT